MHPHHPTSSQPPCLGALSAVCSGSHLLTQKLDHPHPPTHPPPPHSARPLHLSDMFTLGSPCLSHGLIVPFNGLPTESCLLSQIVAHTHRRRFSSSSCVCMCVRVCGPLCQFPSVCVSLCLSLISSKRHGWSCLLSADHGQGPAPVRDSHRRLRGLFSHPAAPHHHLRLCVEVSTKKFNQIKKIAAKTPPSTAFGGALHSLLILASPLYLPPTRSLSLFQVHPLRALRDPHQLLPFHHLLKCPHSGRTNSGSQQGKPLLCFFSPSFFLQPLSICFGEFRSSSTTDTDFPRALPFPGPPPPPIGGVHSGGCSPALLLPLLLLLGADRSLAVLHGCHWSSAQPHHPQAFLVPRLG